MGVYITGYKYYQPNKKDVKDETGDCVIRSICKATKQSWTKVFDILCKRARKIQCLPNQKPAYEDYLFKTGWEYISIYKQKKTVQEFVEKHRKGTYIIFAKVGFGGHLVCAEDGIYYDTWDSGEKLVYGYYVKNND